MWRINIEIWNIQWGAEDSSISISVDRSTSLISHVRSRLQIFFRSPFLLISFRYDRGQRKPWCIVHFWGSIWHFLHSYHLSRQEIWAAGKKFKSSTRVVKPFAQALLTTFRSRRSWKKRVKCLGYRSRDLRLAQTLYWRRTQSTWDRAYFLMLVCSSDPADRRSDRQTDRQIDR